MNVSTNYSSYYLNLNVCEAEKSATPWYIATLGIMLVLALYFLTSLVMALTRGRNSGIDTNCTIQYSSILRCLLVVVIVTINIRLTLDLAQLGMGSLGYDAFGAIFLTKAVLSTINSACVYGFLWLRQWVLYDQPMLRKVKTTVFKIFNVFVLILVVSLVAAGPVVEVRYVKLKLTEDGCMLVRTHKWTFALAIYTAFSLAYQVVLLGFFIYPLKHTRSHAASDDASTVAPIVKRSSLSAAACFADEIVFIIIHHAIERPLMLNTVTTELKLIVYYVCLVSSYNDWRKKFCFPCASKTVRKHSLSRVASDCKSKLSSEDMEGKTLKGNK